MKALLFLATFLLFVPMTNGFCDSFRCGRQAIVNSGEDRGTVAATCGSPAYKASGESKNEGTFGAVTNSRKSGSTINSTTSGEYSSKSVNIEYWTYNCGERDYIYRLEFKNGILDKVESTGRGSGPSKCY